MARSYLTTKWRLPRVVIVLFIIELGGTVAGLALFGIAAPDTFRTNLWKDGAMNGFNSDPSLQLYAYANYRPVPPIALIWSQFITTYNVVISVVSMFILLIKGVMWVMHMWYPLLSLIVHVCITGMWTFSLYAQASPDYADPQHPSKVPWYLSKSCNVAYFPTNKHGCVMAKSAFAATAIMLFIFVVHIPLSIYSMFPGKRANHSRMTSDESEMKIGAYDESPASDGIRTWEMSGANGGKPLNPMTPRTLAFNTLSNDLPLRQQK